MSTAPVVPAAGGPRPGPLVVGIDLGTPDERTGDAVLGELVATLAAAAPAASVVAATHWARASGLPHVALSVQLSGIGREQAWELLLDAVPGAGERALCLGQRRTGPAARQRDAELAAAEAAGRTGGRAVHYPGVEELVGTVRVADVLRRTPIDRVRVLAGAEADPQAPLVTRSFVRPTWSQGELVLTTQPAAGGTLVPFETPTPTPCCRDHA